MENDNTENDNYLENPMYVQIQKKLKHTQVSKELMAAVRKEAIRRLKQQSLKSK